MIPICCEQCGKLFGDFAINYIDDLNSIINKYTILESEYNDNDDDDYEDENEQQELKNKKNVLEETKKLLDKYYVTKLCCRTNLMTFYNTIKYIK